MAGSDRAKELISASPSECPPISFLKPPRWREQILGVQMGYSLINILDPQTQVDTTVVAVFHQMVAFLLFLQLNVHHWILRGIASSFEYLSPGAVNLNRGLTAELLHGIAGVLVTVLNCGPGHGGNVSGRCDSGISRQGLTTNASDVLGARVEKHAGHGTTGEVNPLLAGTVSAVLHRIRGIF